MRILMQKLALGTACVLALGIAGTALEYAANAGSMMNTAGMAGASQTSDNWRTREFLRKDDLRWAQVELRFRGLYRGSLDGVLGPETKRALSRFQKIDGLDQTASLDTRTLEALTGNPGAQGQSRTPGYAEAITNSFAASGFGPIEKHE